MKTKTKIIVALVSILGIGTGVIGCKRSHKDKVEFATYMIGKKLKLDDSQKVFLDDVKKELNQLKSEMNNEKKKYKEEFEKIILSDELNQSRVLELIELKHKKINEKLPVILNKIATLHGSLKLEQKQKLIKLIEKFHKHH